MKALPWHVSSKWLFFCGQKHECSCLLCYEFRVPILSVYCYHNMWTILVYQGTIYPSQYNHWLYTQLVGGFKHEFYFPFHIWDNPSHERTHIFQDGSNHQPAIILLTYKPNIAAKKKPPQWNGHVGWSKPSQFHLNPWGMVVIKPIQTLLW